MAWIDKLISLSAKADIPRAKEIYETLPHMAKAYSPKAVNYAIESTPPGQLTTLTPREFKKLAFPLPNDQAAPYVKHYQDLLTQRRWVEPPPNLFMEHYLDDMRGRPFEGFSDVPYLQYLQDPTRDNAGQVIGHEGRHRMRALDELYPPDTEWLTRIQRDPLPPNPRFIYPQHGIDSVNLSRKRRFAGGGLVRLAKSINRVDEAPRALSRPNIIKEPGGNWLAGSPNFDKKPFNPEELAKFQKILETSTSPDSLDNAQDMVANLKGAQAYNRAVDKKLVPYVKNLMGTKDDPIRKGLETWPEEKAARKAKVQSRLNTLNAKTQRLAEEKGVPEEYLTRHRQEIVKAQKELDLIEANKGVHAELEYEPNPDPNGYLGTKRRGFGYPVEGVATSLPARAWENMADATISIQQASSVPYFAHKNPRSHAAEILKKNPWLDKLEPETPVYDTEFNNRVLEDDSRFEHMMDEIFGALMDGRITTDQLEKMNIQQMSRLVGDISAERAVKASDIAKADTAAMPLHKEYPTGHSWRQLKTPDDTPEGRNTLQRWLTNEGDTMAHCVGGYCPDVVSGRSEIYSLRGPNGKPGVTIETRPHKDFVWSDLTPQQKHTYQNWVDSENNGVNLEPDEFTSWVANTFPESVKLPFIKQIKGFENSKPADEFQPMIEDFIRSGKWSDIKDRDYTNLTDKQFDEILRGKVDEENPGFAGGGLLKLYHGGRKFSKWDPSTIGTGEGKFLAQGPGLYAGNNPDLAKVYLKYGGKNPALSELLVDPTTIIQPQKKMSEAHREIYDRAAKSLDSLGLRATSNGIPNAFLMGRSYNPQEVRQALIESGLGGLKQDLHNAYGDEFAIFNPDIIKSIKPSKFAGGGLLSKVGALGRLAARNSDTVGARQPLQIMGQRGAASLGNAHYQRLLDEEFNAAAKMKARGEDPRMRSASPSPKTYTGFELKPRIEMETQGFTPKIHTPTTNHLPLKDTWNLEPWLQKAFPDLVDRTKVLHSPDHPLGSGHFDSRTGEIMIGMNQEKFYPAERKILQESPHLVDEIMTKTLGHELLGHGVAGEERYTPGTSPSAIERIMTTNSSPKAIKSLLMAEFLTELASGASLYKTVDKYSKIDPRLKPQLMQHAQSLKHGYSTPENLIDQSAFLRDDAKRYREAQMQTDQINQLVNGEILRLGPPDILKAAQELEKDEGTIAAKAYIGYRANAGENDANLIGSRMSLSPMVKQDIPLVSQNKMLNQFLHSISR